MLKRCFIAIPFILLWFALSGVLVLTGSALMTKLGLYPTASCFQCPPGEVCQMNAQGWSVVMFRSVEITPPAGSLGIRGR